MQSWDCANKQKELASYSVCTTWGVAGKNIYLLDVFRKQINYPELKRAVHAFLEQYPWSNVLIEDRVSGTQLIQELKEEGMANVTAIEPHGEKIMRMHAQTALIENGFVFLPEKAPWLAVYLHELTTFPMSKHSDQVDSTSQALAWINAGYFGPSMGIFHYYRLLSEEQKRTKG